MACRNVLLYLTAAAARTVLGRLHAALRPGGMLLVGPIEEPLTAGLPFERLVEDGATVLRRPGAAHGAGRGGASA